MTTPDNTPSDMIRDAFEGLDAIEADLTVARTDIAATRHALRIALQLIERKSYEPPTITDLEDDR
jgi:hypothetical protein